MFRKKRRSGIKDVELKKLDNIVTQRKKSEKQQFYITHRKVFDIVLNFITDKNLMIYGGRAINAILPRTHRFYEKYDLPDVDFFSFKAKEDSIELADLLRNNGYKYVEVKSGIHYETFKLYVDFYAVADITDIPKRLFNRMKEMSEDEKVLIKKYAPDCNIPVAPLNFLRLSMHIEFSRPDGYIERWTKIYRRLGLLYDYYPIKYVKDCSGYEIDNDPMILRLHDTILKQATAMKLPIFGISAIKMYLKEGDVIIPDNAIISKKMTLIDVIAKNHIMVANRLKYKLSKGLDRDESILLKHHAPLNSSEILPRHIVLYYVKESQGKSFTRPLVGIYKSQACYSYKTIKDTRIGSIDTILSFMYAWLLSDRVYFTNSRIQCLLSWLLNAQYLHLGDDMKLFNMFEKNCYGHQIGINDLKKQMWGKPSDKIVYRPSLINK